MDFSILKIVPLLVQAAAVLGQRSFNVSSKTFLAQIAFAGEFLPLASSGEESGGADVNSLLVRIDSTRAHLRHIAGIISHESRALESELVAIADEARSLAKNGEDGRIYRRRWKAKP